MRARSRARAESLRARQAAKSRLNAGLWRQERRARGQAHGRPAPRRWRAAGVGPTPAPHRVFPAEGRSPHPPHAARVWHRPSRPGATRGAAPPWARPSRRGGGSRGRGRSRPSPHAATARACPPPTAAAGSRPDARSLCQGRTPRAGRPPHDGPSSGPPRPGGRRRGRPRSGAGPAPSPTAPGTTAHTPPGPPLAGAGPAGPTVATTPGARPAAPSRRGREGARRRRLSGGDGPGQNPPGKDPACRWCGHGAGQPGAPSDRTRRRPGVGPPSSACCGGKTPACRDRGRDPTDTRQVVAHPRLAAGAPVVSDGLRLCR